MAMLTHRQVAMGIYLHRASASTREALGQGEA